MCLKEQTVVEMLKEKLKILEWERIFDAKTMSCS